MDALLQLLNARQLLAAGNNNCTHPSIIELLFDLVKWAMRWFSSERLRQLPRPQPGP